MSQLRWRAGAPPHPTGRYAGASAGLDAARLQPARLRSGYLTQGASRSQTYAGGMQYRTVGSSETDRLRARLWLLGNWMAISTLVLLRPALSERE
jgi:hypothetical protein